MKPFLVIATLLTLCTSASLAGPKHFGKQHSITHLAKQLVYQLDLSADQKAQIKAIAEEFKANKKTKSREARKDNREQMEAIMKAPSFDESAARAILKARFDAKIENRIAYLKAKHQILATLTEAQRDEVAAAMKNRRQRN